MILANGCNITKSEKFKGVWILSVPTVYLVNIWYIMNVFFFLLSLHIQFNVQFVTLDTLHILFHYITSFFFRWIGGVSPSFWTDSLLHIV